MLKNLLAMNRKALIGLHNIGWLDFQKPYLISEYHGNFTANSIFKAMNIDKWDAKAYNIYILYTDPRPYSTRNELYLARLNGDWKFESERKNISGYEAAHGWRWLDTKIGKATFEEIRKNPECHYFVIAQEKAYENRRGKVVDLSARFKPIYASWSKDSKYKSVEAIVPTGRRVDNYYDNIMQSNRYGYITTYYELDKSGYLVSENRANYEQRAKKLRAERSAKAAAAWDNTETIKGIDERVARINERVAKLLTGKAETIPYNDIGHACDRIYWCNHNIKNIRNNKYDSMGDIEWSIKQIDKYLTEAEKAIGEVK